MCSVALELLVSFLSTAISHRIKMHFVVPGGKSPFLINSSLGLADFRLFDNINCSCWKAMVLSLHNVDQCQYLDIYSPRYKKEKSQR